MSEERRYKIEEKIGAGGIGAVYQAYDNHLGRKVALKRMLPPDASEASEDTGEVEAAENLMNEAKVLSALQHPNIVTVYDIGTDDEGGFVVMELLDGETLDETIGRGVLTMEDFGEVVTQTLEAMIAAQDLHLVHRDLKPSNVMVIWLPSEKFQLKILDFGLAKFSKKPSVQTSDQGDAIMGSIYFMAPEQFERGELDARTDMYSLGCIYYYTLTGQYPFRGDTAAQVMASHLQGNYTPLEKYRPDLPSWMAEWVMWLLQRNMEERPETAKQALDYFNAQTSPLAEARLAAQAPVQAVAAPTMPVRAGSAEDSAGVQVVQAPSAGAAPPPGYQPPKPGGASARKGASSSGKISKTTWVVILVSAMSILLIGGYVIIKRGAEIKRQNELTRILEQEEKVGDPATVRFLLEFYRPGNSKLVKDGVSQALSELKGDGVSQEIMRQMDSFSGLERVALVKILTIRGHEDAVPKLLEYVATSRDPELRTHSLNGIRLMGDPSQAGELLAILEGTDEEQVRQALERALVTMYRAQDSDQKRTGAVIRRLEEGNLEAADRQSLLRVLGYLGGEKALEFFTNALSNQPKDYQFEVLSALMHWPDHTAAPIIADLGLSTDDVALKAGAARAYARLIKIPAPREPEDTKQMLDNLWSIADAKRDQALLFDILSRIPQDWASEYAGEYAEDKAFGPYAKRAQETIGKAISEVPLLVPGEMLGAPVAKTDGAGGAYIGEESQAVVNWTNPETWVYWDFSLEEAGTYAVALTLSSKEEAGSEFNVIVGNQLLSGAVRDTRGEDNYIDVDVGAVSFEEPGIYRIAVKPTGMAKKFVMNLKGVTFVKKS